MLISTYYANRRWRGDRCGAILLAVPGAAGIAAIAGVASRLNLTRETIATSWERKDHAGDTVSVLQRPLRGSGRVLQEGARRRGRDDDAVQGEPGQAAARHGPGWQRRQDHARVPAHQRRGGDGVRRLRTGEVELRRLLALAECPRRGRGRPHVRGARRRRQGADAARQDLLRQALRRGC